MSNDFRDLLFDTNHPRLAELRGIQARRYGAHIKEIPAAGALSREWETLAQEPFVGLTCDGCREPGLFAQADEGAPMDRMVHAATALLLHLSADQRAKVRFSIEAEQWRYWSNPEFLWNDNGLRLDQCSASVQAAVLDLVRASLSETGYVKARDCMRVNAFLGELTDLPLLMNEFSYNFLLFGEPSCTEPWGWNFYGHHLALNCFVLGKQMVISPTFMGAEPNTIDVGAYSGVTLFTDEERLGTQLMRDLPTPLRARAQLAPTMTGAGLPPGRKHPADGFHMGGAFQDNRVVPLEGISAENFEAVQRDTLMRLMTSFIEYLPEAPLRAKLHQIEQHLDRTYWSWIGGYGDADPFYYRIQSPVIMMEFDHHQGVWLNNSTPARCHIHTVVRTPNGNDYGKDLLKQHYAQIHPGEAPGSA